MKVVNTYWKTLTRVTLSGKVIVDSVFFVLVEDSTGLQRVYASSVPSVYAGSRETLAQTIAKTGSPMGFYAAKDAFPGLKESIYKM